MKTKLLSLILIMTILLAGCGVEDLSEPTEPDRVRMILSWNHGVQFLGYYIAQENGYYADENLSVEIIPLSDSSIGSQIPELIVAGEYDFSSSANGLINAQVEGIPVTAFSTVLNFSPVSFFARADSGIVTPADLKGRSIVIKGQAWEDLLLRLLAHGDLTLDDVETVRGSFDMTPFFEGEVEVWAGFLTDEVIRARLSGLDLVTFPLYEYDIDVTPFNLYTRHELIETQPDLAVRFLRATLHGWEWVIENPVESVDIMLANYPDIEESREFHLASIDAYIPLVQNPDRPLGAIDCDAWLNDPKFAELDSTDWLCTTDIFEAAN